MVVHSLPANTTAHFSTMNAGMLTVEVTPDQLSTIGRIARRLLDGMDRHNRWVDDSAYDHHLTPGEAAHALRHLIEELTKIGVYDGTRGYLCPKSHAQQFQLLIPTVKRIEAELAAPNDDGRWTIATDRMQLAESLRYVLSNWSESEPVPEPDPGREQRRQVTLRKRTPPPFLMLACGAGY